MAKPEGAEGAEAATPKPEPEDPAATVRKRLCLLERPVYDPRAHAVPTRTAVRDDLARLAEAVRRNIASYAALLNPTERPEPAELHLGRLHQVLEKQVDPAGRLDVFPLATGKGAFDRFKVNRDVLDGEDHSTKIQMHEADLQALERRRKEPGSMKSGGSGGGAPQRQGPGNTRMASIMRGPGGSGEARGGPRSPGVGGDDDGVGEKRRRKRSLKDRENKRFEHILLKRKAKAISELLTPVVTKLWEMNDTQYGNPFRMVVDRNNAPTLGIPDYFDIVSKPMNLTWMREKVKKHEYQNVAAFEEDLKLMVDNAQKYNPVGHGVHTFAQTVLDKYENDFRVAEPLLSEDEVL